MGSFAAARSQYALTGLQEYSVSSVTVWSALLDYGGWPWLLTVALAAGIAARQWRRLVRWGTQIREKLNPPDRVAARKLLRACRHNDAAAAEAAWIAWRNTQDLAFRPDPKLRLAILGLQRCLFGPAPAVSWRGDGLAHVFGESLVSAKAYNRHKRSSTLPLLNPQE